MNSPTPPLPELVNFCLEPLACVHSTAVSADGYPLTNLISINPSVRAKGFRVERFIRPPLQLDFEFELPVNVACIIIEPELSAQSEMRLEVSASYHNSSTCTNLMKICPSVVIDESQAMLVLENKAFKKCDGKVFSISKTDLTSCRVEGSFTSQSVLRRLLGVGLSLKPLKYPNILTKLRQMSLLVTRITGPKPFALKNLEVWGSPSSSSAPSQLNRLWSSLASAHRELSSAHSDRVKLYCSEASSPGHGPEPGKQDSLTSNDIHSSSADMHQSCCSYARYEKTLPSHERKCHKVECVRLAGEECDCEGVRVAVGRTVFGQADTVTQEVNHIKQVTSENKKSLKPQQSVVSLAHLRGCSHNIGECKQKPGSSGGRCHGPRRFLEGKNGSLPSAASLMECPTHNTDSDDDEDTSQSSCGLRLINSSKASIAPYQHKHKDEQKQNRRQQLLEGAQTPQPTPPPSGHCEVPSEFLDKITYDIMHVPMLLPSGHYVDQSTLERLADNDALYGRPPTDPFTGIPFTGTAKPEFFPELKVRLDRFLTSPGTAKDTGPSTATYSRSARTLGSADQITAHLCRVKHRGDVDRCSRDRAECSGEGASKEPPRKKLRSTTMEDTSYGSPAHGRGRPGSTVMDQRATNRMQHHDKSCSQTNHNHQKGRNRFEQELAGSLDQALKRLLSDSPFQ